MNAPSVNFWMFPLCTSVTDLRFFSTAYLIAARIRRFEPVSEIGLMPTPESSRMSQPNSFFRISIERFASGVPSSTSRPA